MNKHQIYCTVILKLLLIIVNYDRKKFTKLNDHYINYTKMLFLYYKKCVHYIICALNFMKILNNEKMTFFCYFKWVLVSMINVLIILIFNKLIIVIHFYDSKAIET